MPNEQTLTVITAKIPKELHAKARKKSADTGVPLSFVVRKAIEAWVADSSKNKPTA